MKRILVTGAGGSPSTNFIRSLRDAQEKFYIVGADANEYLLLRSEADVNYLIPKVSDTKYLASLNALIKKERISFIHSQNDDELFFLSENRENINANTFLPPKQTVRICQDKFKSVQKWKEANITIPNTMLIRNDLDLKKAFDLYAGNVWLRNIHGAGGRGSLPATNYMQAKAWIEFHNGWGDFTAAEMLGKESITWMSLWNEGNLIVAQGRKRLYWELSRIAPSGITGVTGAGITVKDKTVDEISQKAIYAIDNKPHGLYGVDLTYDKNRIPNPTEINIGRFFTTHYFFTKAGLNMPYIYVKIAFNESYPEIKQKINPLDEDLIWIRGVDFLPILTTKKAMLDNK